MKDMTPILMKALIIGGIIVVIFAVVFVAMNS